MRISRSLTVLGSVLIMTLGGIAIAHAVAPTPGSITACANKSNGTMRLLTTGTCKTSETAVSWPASGDGTGIQGYEIVERSYDVQPGSPTAFDAGIAVFCPDGKKVIEGGVEFYDFNGDSSDLNSTGFVTHTVLADNGRTYLPYIHLDRGNPTTRILLHAACASVATP